MEEPGARNITMTDIAKRAGVSLSTTSLSFSAPERVSEATRAKVLDAAEELGYQGPNPLGRQLRSGRSNIIGVVVGHHLDQSLRDPFSLHIVNSLLTSLTAQEFGVLLIPQSSSTEDDAALLSTAAMDGVVMMWGAAESDASVQQVRHRGIPMVFGQGDPIAGFAQVYIDDRAASRLLAEHVRELGHERVAIASLTMTRADRTVRGFVDKARLAACDFTTTLDRINGTLDAGITPVAIFECGQSVLEAGQIAGRALLDVSPEERPTAIIAQSDVLAVGVIQAARQLGLSVPDDVTVVGFDGIELPWFTRQLTTVHQSGVAKGESLARLIIEAIKDPSSTENIELPVELIIGDTSGPPPAL